MAYVLPQNVFVFAGEGAHSPKPDLTILKTSPSWKACDDALNSILGTGVEAFLSANAGDHKAPSSPLTTTLINILHADLWRSSWGFEPTYAVGHSIGEVAAAYVAGLLSVAEALDLANRLGKVAAELPGAMLHTVLPASQLADLPTKQLHLAAVNCQLPGTKDMSVSLCGAERHVAEWLAADEGATKLMPAHPWHHPMYRTTKAFRSFASELPPPASYSTATCSFVSATKVCVLTSIDAAHWEEWLTAPVQFAAAMALVAERAAGAPLVAIQLGPHPVLDGAVAALAALPGANVVGQASSLKRNTPALPYVRSQRGRLAECGALEAALRAALSKPRALRLTLGSREIDVEIATPFPEQGMQSAQYPALARRLAAFFPGVAAHDLYRFTTVEALLHGWDAPAGGAAAAKEAAAGGAAQPQRAVAGLDVMGCGVLLPPQVRSAEACWEALCGEKSAIGPCPDGFKGVPSGFLAPQVMTPLSSLLLLMIPSSSS